MNLILLFQEDFIHGTSLVRLQGRRQQHVLHVHRVSVGDELCVGMAGGKVGRGQVTRLDERVLEMDVSWTSEPPAALPVTLLVALPRPPIFKRVLFSATAMGVKRMIFFQTSRVEKSFWRSHCLLSENVREQVVLGLEQARDTIFPEVIFRKRFKPFVEDELPSVMQGSAALVAHPQGTEPCPRALRESVTLVIGPEGGFIPYEVEKLASMGFITVNLGERILRVDTAIVALLSRLFS